MKVQLKATLMSFAFAFVAAGVVSVLASGSNLAFAHVAPTEPIDNITICHANEGVKMYSSTPVNVSSINNLTDGNGHGTDNGTHGGDIIPPFTNLAGESYPGKNWTTENQAIYSNDCAVPEEEPEVDYCDPASFKRGSVADNVPLEVVCVDFTVVEACGELGVNLINDTTLNYAVSWSEGEADWNFDTALPATFSEDYNGGSVDVYYWLVGEEADYVTNRGIYNYWEQENPGADMVTVDTDCETTTVPEDDDEEETNGTVVLGTSTDTPARAGELPTSLPVTGANEQLAAIVTIVSTIATAAGVYTLRGRSADLSL